MDHTIERALTTADTELGLLKKSMERLCANWDNKHSTENEDKYDIAKEIQEKCDELRSLIGELI